MQPEADSRFHTAIAVIPDASLFYCVCEQYPAVVTVDNHNKHATHLVAPGYVAQTTPATIGPQQSLLALAW
jgi:hypothetical protein